MPPRIIANYLTDPDDMRIMVAAFRIARQIAATEPFRSLVTEQLRPGPDIKSDEQIADYVRKVGSTVYHPCGTCRMGEDDGAVVDSQLRVRGIDGLRVVDASVMPAMPSPNIHPATIMVAEKGRISSQKGSRTDRCEHYNQFVRAAGTLISCGRMIAAAIASRQSAAKACSMVAKPPCS